VGKHVAPEGASADPIVADALAHRSPEHAHHAAAESPVGWPGEPAPEGGGIGWPGDLPPVDEGSTATAGAPAVRRGWRRLFHAGRVA